MAAKNLLCCFMGDTHNVSEAIFVLSLYYPCFNIIHGKPFSHPLNGSHVVPLAAIFVCTPPPLPHSPVLIVLNLPIRVTVSGRARVEGAINTAAY
jgi:hypothetical protein